MLNRMLIDANYIEFIGKFKIKLANKNDEEYYKSKNLGRKVP